MNSLLGPLNGTDNTEIQCIFVYDKLVAIHLKQYLWAIAQPSECGRQHTLISIHAQTSAGQQSNGNSEARMSEKCGEWRD